MGRATTKAKRASLSQRAKVAQPWQLLHKGSRPVVLTMVLEGVHGDAIDTWEARARGQDTAPSSRGSWQVRGVIGQGTMSTTTDRGALHGPSKRPWFLGWGCQLNYVSWDGRSHGRFGLGNISPKLSLNYH
uniref:Uncharacterized protein n=1 Tax=Solanum tuberosum TaxID=4113 RepID=M1DCV4_SOLTU